MMSSRFLPYHTQNIECHADESVYTGIYHLGDSFNTTTARPLTLLQTHTS